MNATIHTIQLYREANIDAGQLIQNELSEFGIEISQAKDEFKENVQKKYVDSVISQLELRFPHVVQIASFSLFDPTRQIAARLVVMAMKNWKCCVTCMEKETILMSTLML